MSDLLQRFARIAIDQPERPLVFAGIADVHAASDLWERHLVLQQALSAIGIGADQLVISAIGNRPAAIPLFLACLSLGASLMPVDAGATGADINDFATRFGASAVVWPDASIRACGPSNGLSYRGAALLKLTSGSTGFPKATLTGESHLIADGIRIVEAMGIAPEDVQLGAIPVSHSYGFGNLVMPLLLQGTACVLRESFVPQQLLADARTFQARVFPGVPYMFNYFSANAPADGWPPSLHLLISAGARLDLPTAEAFRAQFGITIHSFYGASEAGGMTYDAGGALSHTGYVGRPMPGVAMTLREDAAAPAGSGRVFVRSPSVAIGYLHPEDDQESPFVDSGYLTGDYGALDADGGLTLTGRASTAVNVAGRKVEPAEVERVLLSMDGIDEARVIAAPDERRGQQIAAFVIGKQQTSALAVRRFCSARLAPHKVPRAIIFLPALPKTARGKTDHARLLALAMEHLDDGV